MKNITGYKKMCFSLLCLFSFTAASHVAFPSHFVYTGSSVAAGRHFVAMDVGLNTKKLSYKAVPLSLAYAFGFGKWDLGLSASYALSREAYQASFISKYHFFSGDTFDLGVTGAVGALGAGMGITPLVNVFFVGSSRWGAYEAALDLGFSPTLMQKHRFSNYRGAKSSSTADGEQNKRSRGGRKKSSWWLSAVKVGTSHTCHWTSDFSTTLAFHTNLKARYFALNLQVRHLF